MEHLFLHSGEAKKIWTHFAELFHLNLPETNSVVLMIQYWRLSAATSSQTHIRTTIPLLILWFIWCERNDVRHREKKFTATRVILRVMQHVFNLQQTNILKFDQWKGDCNVARTLGLWVEKRRVAAPIIVR